jgi:hypothetical protein
MCVVPTRSQCQLHQEGGDQLAEVPVSGEVELDADGVRPVPPQRLRRHTWPEAGPVDLGLDQTCGLWRDPVWIVEHVTHGLARYTGGARDVDESDALSSIGVSRHLESS